MKKRSLVISTSLIGLLVLVAVSVLVVTRAGWPAGKSAAPKQSAEASSNSANGDQGSAVGGPGQPADTSKAGAYVVYRDAIIRSTVGQKILFFYGSGCGQCQQLEQSIASGPIPAHVTIIKVDYDANAPLRGKYGVSEQASFVRVDDQGGLIKKYVADKTPTLQAVLQNLL